MKTFIREFFIFGIKQAYASLFGGFLLFIMLTTNYYYPLENLHRYDFIFLAAIFFQIFLLVFKLEKPKEFWMIIAFHIVATIMEIFKTSPSIASWTYPEEYFFGIKTVPLFTGFMYSAVGSYIARVWRIFDFQFNKYPPKYLTIILVSFIYINFFTHHYIYDIRWILLVCTVILFYKVDVYYKMDKIHRKMPLLLGWFLVALFIWFAENLATFAKIWVYPNQAQTWHMVSFSKITAWFLLMLLSFVLISLITKIKIKNINTHL